jgi:hypothetical protein
MIKEGFMTKNLMELKMKEMEFERNELKNNLALLKKELRMKCKEMSDENWILQKKLEEYQVKFGFLLINFSLY